MKRHRKELYTPTDLNDNVLYRLSENDNSLVRVIFSSRNLGHQGTNKLCQALRTNTRLAALDLSSNLIETKGAHLIASLLVHQSSMINYDDTEGRGIKTLILGDNNLRDDGVKALACAIENNCTLESLWLDDNCIGATGLAILSDSLSRNNWLERLHLKHNSFQSLSPLIKCTFNKKSIDSVANSNHTLKHVFLNCGYSYECEELESILKINRLGKVEARRTKIAMFLEEDLGRLFQQNIDPHLLPLILGILGQHGTNSSMFCAMRNLPSEVLFCQGNCDRNPWCEDPMDVEYL